VSGVSQRQNNADAWDSRVKLGNVNEFLLRSSSATTAQTLRTNELQVQLI